MLLKDRAFPQWWVIRRLRVACALRALPCVLTSWPCSSDVIVALSRSSGVSVIFSRSHGISQAIFPPELPSLCFWYSSFCNSALIFFISDSKGDFCFCFVLFWKSLSSLPLTSHPACCLFSDGAWVWSFWTCYSYFHKIVRYINGAHLKPQNWYSQK